MNTEVMTIRELSAYLKLAEKTAYRLVSEKKTLGFKVGCTGVLKSLILING